jgi:hypothetical protein
MPVDTERRSERKRCGRRERTRADGRHAFVNLSERDAEARDEKAKKKKKERKIARVCHSLNSACELRRSRSRALFRARVIYISRAKTYSWHCNESPPRCDAKLRFSLYFSLSLSLSRSVRKIGALARSKYRVSSRLTRHEFARER